MTGVQTCALPISERVEWDNYYIAHWSLALDLKIMALTFASLFHDAE